MPRTSNNQSETSTTRSDGSIGISDVNAATRHFTGDGSMGNHWSKRIFREGKSWNSQSGLKALHEYVGGMYYSADASGGADGSLTVGPHAFTRYPSFKGSWSTQNKVTPYPEELSLGDMRHHTPLTVFSRVQCRTVDADKYYNTKDGKVAIRPYGVNENSHTFSVSMAGETKTWSSKVGPAAWWTGLGGDGASWGGYRVKIGWSYTYNGKTAAQTIKNIAIGMGAQDQGSTFHGRYGWSFANGAHASSVKNYVSKYFGVWTSRSAFTSNSKSSKFTTGGSQAPNATSVNQTEWFYDWFYCPATTIKFEACGDDQIQVMIKKADGTTIHDTGLKGGAWNSANPKFSQKLTISEAGWYQVMCKAVEKAATGTSPAFVGCVIWDVNVHGDDGPPTIKKLRAFNVEHGDYAYKNSDGCLWTSAKNAGSVTTSDSQSYDVTLGAYRWHTQAGKVTPRTSIYSDRLWWLPQVNKFYREK